MQPFQEFQFAFARHIRDPRGCARPAGVPARRMAIYNELLYNNLEGFLLACFPVSRAILGERRWPRLVRAFFREARCHTPYFREIPREFVRWLLDGTAPLPLPPWFTDLAHYEWAELAVDVMDVEPMPFDAAGDLLAGAPVLAPALMNLAYQWPVHRIGPNWRPRRPLAVHLLVYRDAADEVQFMELNPVSARLVALLQAGGRTGRDACLNIAAELGHPQPDALIAHGAQLLGELRESGAILGALA
jgi:hypothetical protein